MSRKLPLRLGLLLSLALPASALPPIAFEDDFSNNSSNWAVWNNSGSGMWFRNGTYHMEVRGDFNQPSRIWREAPFIDPTRDFAIETRMTYLTGNTQNPYCSYWVEWAVNPNGNDFHTFGIYADGRFQYGKRVNNQWIPLMDAIRSPAVRAGDNSTNVLTVERRKAKLYFSINGTPVHEAAYEPFNPSHKAIAFQVDRQLQAEVDYLRIYQEPAAPGNPFFGTKGLYPKFTSLNKDAKLYGNGYLFSGGVEGNVQDGEGLYVTIQKLNGNNGPYLQYWYFKGRFSDGGRKFTGGRYSKSIPLTLEKNDYRSKDGTVQVSDPEKNAYNGFTGDFVIVPMQGGYKDLPSFVLQGRGERDLWAIDQYKWKGCSGVYHGYEAVFLSIDYDGTRKFTGLVAPGYRPLFGVMDYGNGDRYEGGWLNDQYFGPGRLTKNGQVQEGLWTATGQLASAEKVFIPDVATLHKVASNPGRNVPFDLKLNPFNFAGGWENNFAVKIFDEKGEVVGEDFTGTGVAFSNNRNLYIGEFKNGRPEGTGCYRVDRAAEGNFGAGPNVYAGAFENGFFLSGVAWHKTKSDKGLANVQSTTPVFRGAQELRPAARLLASGRAKEGEEQLAALSSQGNSEAGYWLGKLHQDGVAVPKNIGKALGYYQASADKNYLPSIIALGQIYGNGKEGVAADRAKAMVLMRKGAELKPGAEFSAESIDYCRGNYFVLKYPFLTFDRAVKFSLADEGNPASELGRVLAAESEKFAAAERQKAAQAKAQADAREEFRISTNKLGWIKGTYLQNLKTKWIYHVSPNRPLYEGNLVEISIRFEDTKLTEYVYEKLENLLNEGIYKKVVAVKRCDPCQGRGVISRSYSRTVADYEYTLGKKIVQTTTHRDACGNCGGCGLVSK